MRRLMLLAGLFFAIPVIASAQVTVSQPTLISAVNVFLDCQAHGCDSQHFRQEIEFVNWVRDRTVADVHLLITAQDAAGGGSAYQLTYIGLRSFAGDSVTLPLSVPQAATEPERRDLLTRRIGQGLIHYAARTSVADRISFELEEEGDQPAARESVRDPWNLWVFSLGVDGSTNGESRELSRELDLSFDASRISERWKFEFEIEGSYEEDRFELSDRTASRVTRNYNAGIFLARSVAPLWSAGFSVEVGRSTFQNQDLYTRAATLIEYSFFPYDQFSRREITLQYSLGARHFDYQELTIYDRLNERRLDHELRLALDFQQPWGEAGVTLSGSHYLHDIRRGNLSVDGNIDVRLFRGLSLEIQGGYAQVHDQLYIAKGDDDDEDVLLRRRELETNFEYDVSIGINYTFGSIFNNIVNPRLSRGF